MTIWRTQCNADASALWTHQCVFTAFAMSDRLHHDLMEYNHSSFSMPAPHANPHI
ncbi:hypothetical protein [Azospirillum doebereinerae]